MAEEQESNLMKNTVTVENVGPCKKKVCVEIPEHLIKTATDEQYETLRREAVVPGFRKGRAPRRLLEKRFGKETAEQVKLKLLADAADSAVKENDLDILRDPQLDFEKIEMPDAGPLKFEFEVEVRPDFQLPDLQAIPVTKQKLEVTDEQLNSEIERLRRWSGLWEPAGDGLVRIDDQVIADVVLKVEGVEQQENFDNIEIYVRQNGFVGAVPVKKLDELLVNAKVGDVKNTIVDVPKTYFKQEYRGKKIDISITVRDVKSLRPAPLDDVFLARFAVENENELKQKIRDTLQNRLEQQARTEMTQQIYKYMLDNTDLELPLDVVADQATVLLQRQYAALIQRGLSPEQIEEQMKQLQAASEQQAEQQLKTFFLMDKVAEKLGIDVTEEEINGYIAQLAMQKNQRPQRLREQMQRDGSLPQFRLQLRENKCIAHLLESAKITEIEPEIQVKKEKKNAQKTTKTAAAAKKTPKKTKKTAKKKA